MTKQKRTTTKTTTPNTVDPEKLIGEARDRLTMHCMEWLFRRDEPGKLTTEELVGFRRSKEFVSLSVAMGNLVFVKLLAELEQDGAIALDGNNISLVPASPITIIGRVLFNEEPIPAPAVDRP